LPDAHELITLTADIVSAHVSHNTVAPADLPGLISSIHVALTQLGQPAEAEAPAQEPAVSIRASVKPDHIVCLEDGKKLKMLKRYLRTNYNMTPEEYRTKWKLPRDYPMVAPSYAETRKQLAVKIGLGRKAAETAPAPKKATAAKKAPAKPRGIAAAKAAAQAHLGTTED
jgi:predicted transcriptional regulator